jgi:surfactin synthase thioesterase subunit
VTARQILFCLPNAGGLANIYASWATPLKPHVRVQPVSLPGRERLHHLPHCHDSKTLIAQILPAVTRELTGPYAIFGHSMGALVAYELACALRDAGHGEPTRLIVSAYHAAHAARRKPPIHAASDAILLDNVRSLGGAPEELLASSEYVEFMLPMLRADLAVLETYRFEPRPPLTCPIVAIGGQDDRRYLPDELDGWRELTVGRFEKRVFPGGHFYLVEQRKLFLAYLRELFETA